MRQVYASFQTMKIVDLNCNQCGALLEVGPKTNFVTCSFCNSRLKIHHTESSHYSEVLEEVKTRSEKNTEDIAKLKQDSALKALDSAWRQERESLLVRDKHGGSSAPEKWFVLFFILIGMAFTIVSFIMIRSSPFNEGPLVYIFPLFGIVFTVFGSANAYRAADRYKKAHRRYMAERARLMRER